MATQTTPTPIEARGIDYGHPPEHGYVELNEEQASQGYKTGHMRWVLAIGFILAGLGLGAAALFS